MFQFRLPIVCARIFTFSAVTLKIVWAVARMGAFVFRSCVVAMKTPYSRCHTVSVPPCQEENCQDFALSCTAWRPLLPVRSVDGKNKVERWVNHISPLPIVIFITQRFPQQCTDTFASVSVWCDWCEGFTDLLLTVHASLSLILLSLKIGDWLSAGWRSRPRLYLHDVFSRADEFVRMRADASLQIVSPSTMGRKTRTKWLFCAYLASLRVSVCLLTHFFHVSYEPDCAVTIRTAFAFTAWALKQTQQISPACIIYPVTATRRVWLCLLFSLPQCTQSTKGMLGRVVRSLDFHELCPPGTPKTTPMGLEGSSTVALSAEPSASVSCAQQPTLQSVVTPCPHFSRINKRDSLHSTNPAFRLASPSPSLSRAGFILEDAPEVSFVALPWERVKRV